MKRTRKNQVNEPNTMDFEPIPYYQAIKPVTKKALKSMTLLDKLEKLIEIAENCKLRDDFFQRHSNLIQSIAEQLQLTPSETVMLCPYIANPEMGVNNDDIKNYFGCSPISVLRKREEMKTLIKRRYITKNNCFGNGTVYHLSERAKTAFCDNQALPVVNNTNLTAEAFMRHFNLLVRELRQSNQIDENELHQETLELLKENSQLAIAQNITSLNVPNPDKAYLLYFCKRLVINHDTQVPLGDLRFMAINDIRDEFPTLMRDGTHPFIKEGLLIYAGQDGLFSDNVFQLTDKARDLFLSEYNLPEVIDEVEDDTHSNIINYTDIKPKTMFYAQEDKGQIDTLLHLLNDEQLQAIRERLEKANLRKGFNCLFYGGPGTGKTETVLQLARITGRDIIQVDISSIRDKWYGETEKIVKGIFDNYAERVKKSKRIPILLINEADAVLSVRTSVGGNNPTLEKTENAIQNILLQAMEDIDGIMIATTNLTCNLDSAFERRFLYKVEFHKPSIDAKTHIWKSFLPDLCEADAMTLASHYDFSGGQIENIARKVMVEQLLYGNTPNLSRIEALCSNEEIAGRNKNSRKPIGFNPL